MHFFLAHVITITYFFIESIKSCVVEKNDSTVVDLKNEDNSNAPTSDQSKTTTETTTIKPRGLPTVTHQTALKHVCLIFAVLCYYFLCDYWRYFARAERIYNRDLFVFLLVLLFIVNVVYTSRVLPETSAGCSTTSGGGQMDKLLNREQTEEWKGWMQVMFVWYHYYRAAETYNLIRLFIASYVWMTGFGKCLIFLFAIHHPQKRVDARN